MLYVALGLLYAYNKAYKRITNSIIIIMIIIII